MTLWFESRRYQDLGNAGSWPGPRLLSLLILAIAILAVLLPARAISGPMALGYSGMTRPTD